MRYAENNPKTGMFSCVWILEFDAERKNIMVKKLKDGIWWNGVYDEKLRVFDIIVPAEHGTTYNAYTVKGSEKVALIDTAKAQFEEEYFDNLQQIISPEKVDYIVVNHTEPDHSGSVEKLLEMNPQAEVLGSVAAIGFLKEITNRAFKSRTVKDGDEVSLGDKTLRFISAPNLHWPDTMFTYIPEDKALFTCDFFGAHYGEGTVLRSELTDETEYLKAVSRYFDAILSPFKPFVRKALEKIKPLPIDLICTGHGPLPDCKLPELMALYREKAQEVHPNAEKTVVLAYVSAYGYTKEMAGAIRKGVEEAGVAVHAYNLAQDDTSALAQDLLYADGILLGSPTFLGDALKPVYDLSTTMLPTVHGGKQAAAFGSYGWTGEAVPNLTQRLKQLKMQVSEGIRFRFRSSAEQLKACEAFGRDFAARVKAV